MKKPKIIRVVPTPLPTPGFDAADDAAVKRGANAGWGLGLTLKELCGVKHKIAILAAITALNMVLDGEADAHCFSVWHYPTPQRGCGVQSHREAHRRPWRVASYHPSSKVVQAAPAALPAAPVASLPPDPPPPSTKISPAPDLQPWDEIARTQALMELKLALERMNDAKARTGLDKKD